MKRYKFIAIVLVIFCAFSITYKVSAQSIGETPVEQGGEDEGVGTNIVGGQLAEDGEWPWQVALVYKPMKNSFLSQFCGGTIINKRWIITAAHCVKSLVADDIEIVLGRNILGEETKGSRVAIDKIIIHPDYTDTNGDSDIALIRLSNDYSGSIGTLGLAASSTEAGVGANVTVTGWGDTSENGSKSNELREVTIPVVSNEVCNSQGSYGGTISSKELCAGLLQGGKDSCQGDSGGPLVYYSNNSWELTGVVSGGAGCARPQLYGIYTRVSSFKSWIEQYAFIPAPALDANYYTYYPPQGSQMTELAGYDKWNIPAGENVKYIAGIDLNDDGNDETAVIKNENGDYNFYVYNSPECSDDSKIIARDLWELPAGNNIVGMAGGDFNGDGKKDDIAVVKNENGDHNLYIYVINQGDSWATLIATDLWELPLGNNIIAMTGVDINNDGKDEIGVVKNENGDHNFYAYSTVMGSNPSVLTATDLWNIPENSRTIAIAGGNFDMANPGDEIAVLRNDNGDHNLYIYDAPLGTQASPKLGEDLWNIPVDNTGRILAGIDVFDGDKTLIGIMRWEVVAPYLPVCHEPVNSNYYVYYAPQGEQAVNISGLDKTVIPGGDDIQFIAGIDINNDGIDETATLRSEHGDQNFYVYGTPTCNQAPSELARDLWTIPNDNNIIAMAGGDFDGDGKKNDIAVIRNYNGDHNFYIYRVNPGTTAGTLIATDLWTIPDGNTTIAMAGFDMNNDGKDEVGLIKNERGDHNFYAYITPIGTAAGVLAATDLWNIPERSNILAIAGGNFDLNNPGDEIAVLKNDNGDHNLFIYDAPSGTQAATLLGKDLWNIPSGETSRSITGIDFANHTKTFIGNIKFDRVKYPSTPQCITPVNGIPVITTQPIVQGYVDTPYLYDVNAADSDSPTLTYSLPTAPTGMLIDQNGIITWNPNLTNVGNITVKVTVSDGQTSIDQSFTLNITYNPSSIVNEVNEFFTNQSSWKEDSTAGFTISLSSETLQISTALIDTSVKRITSNQWVNTTSGKTYYIQAQIKVQNADQPKVYVDAYDVNFAYIGNLNTLLGGSNNANSEYRGSFVVPSTLNSKTIKYMKIVLEAGDKFTNTLAANAISYFDYVRFSENGRPYAGIEYKPNPAVDGAMVNLTGISSKDFGSSSPLTYLWKRISGPAEIATSNLNTMTPTFVAPDLNKDYLVGFELIVTDNTGLSSVPYTANVFVRGVIPNLNEEFVTINDWNNLNTNSANSILDGQALRIDSKILNGISKIESPFISVNTANYRLRYRVKTETAKSFKVVLTGYTNTMATVAAATYTCIATDTVGTVDYREYICDITMAATNPTVKYIKSILEFANNTVSSKAWIDYIKLEIPSTNNPPVITTQPTTQAFVNIPYSYDINATDPDNQTLIYALITPPTGMTIDQNGIIAWTPTATNMGNVPIKATVSDGILTVEQNFTLNITYPAASIVNEVNEFFTDMSGWQEDIKASFNPTIVNQTLQLNTALADSSVKKITSAKWVNGVPGRTYYLQGQVGLLNADAAQIYVDAYDVNFAYLGTLSTLSSGFYTIALTEYRVGFTIPTTLNNGTVKYMKIVLQAGDKYYNTFTINAVTTFDYIRLSENARPYAGIEYKPNPAVDGAMVNLTGISSKDLGSTAPLVYAWRKVSGPAEVVLNNSNTMTPTFMAPDLNKDYLVGLELIVTDSTGIGSIPLLANAFIRGIIPTLNEQFVTQNDWVNNNTSGFNTLIENENLRINAKIINGVSKIDSPFISTEAANYRLTYRVKTETAKSFKVILTGYTNTMAIVAAATYTCIATDTVGTVDYKDYICDTNISVTNPTVKYMKASIEFASNMATSKAWVEYIRLDKVVP